MKKANYLFVLLPALLLAFTSCKKCADCTCANSYQYGPEVPEADKTSLESDWEEDHPEATEEICERKKEYESQTADFESMDDNGNIIDYDNSMGYSYLLKYTCNCVEQE